MSCILHTTNEYWRENGRNVPKTEILTFICYTDGYMSTISIADVQKLAQLSALTITDDQVQTLTNELNEILGYVEQLNEVDTDGVEPTYQVNGLENVTRPDEIKDMDVSQEDLLKNAPQQQDGSIKVPRVLE